jgi:16S rRNA (guanine1207-N2)-methyltransferase
VTQYHYFSAEPNTPEVLRQVEFEVAGKAFRLSAASGTFSSTKLDPGTDVLLKLDEHFPEAGTVLDLGCGWGPIGISLAALSEQLEVIGLDVNTRSIELANKNAQSLGLGNFRAMVAEEIPEDLMLDGLWSNPPIRAGKVILQQLMKTWLPRLKPGCSAYLVIAKHLGAESLQRFLETEFPDSEVTKVENSKGYRVLKFTRAKLQ